MINKLEIYVTSEATNELIQLEIQMKGYWLPIMVRVEQELFEVTAVTPECFINGYENEMQSGRLPIMDNDIIVQNLDKDSIVSRIIQLASLGYFIGKNPVDLNKKYEGIWDELRELKNWIRVHPKK